MSPRGEIAIPIPGKVTGQGKLSRKAVKYGGLVCRPGNRRKEGAVSPPIMTVAGTNPAIGVRTDHIRAVAIQGSSWNQNPFSLSQGMGAKGGRASTNNPPPAVRGN